MNDLKRSWYEEATLQIGTVLNKDSISKIGEVALTTLDVDMSSKIQIFRARTIENFGNSAEKIVQYINKTNNKG